MYMFHVIFTIHVCILHEQSVKYTVFCVYLLEYSKYIQLIHEYAIWSRSKVYKMFVVGLEEHWLELKF